MLDKRTNFRVIAVFHDIDINAIAFMSPSGSISRETPLVGESNASIQGDPTHDFGIHKMPTPTTDFPNAFVGQLPVVTHIIEEPTEVHPEIKRNGRAMGVIEIHGVHESSIHVELQLMRRGIANAHRF